ncbi:hypothetical protein GCM10027038_20660 [Arthrobacter bambusae]
MPVNRDAMAAFMYRLAGSPDYTAPATSPFTDVPSGAQFYKEITWLADKGISTGWPGPNGTKTYRPLNSVNRDAMAAFMYRFAGSPASTSQGGSFADVGTDNQFYNQITWLASQGISTGWTETNGSKTYRPLGAVNRDAMAAFMYRFYRVTHPLTISGGALHDGFAGARYLDQVSATGGIAPLTWTATGLPIGITLTSDGALTGVPAATGTNNVNFTVTDAAGTTATTARTLNVPTSMPGGCINQACAVLTPTSRTVQVPASAIVGVTRDASTQRVAAVTLKGPAVNGTTIAAGQVLVLAPTPQITSGAIVFINTMVTNADATVTAAVTPTTPADAYTEATVNSIDPTVPTVTSPMMGGSGTAAPQSTTPGTVSSQALGSSLKCDAGITATLAGLSTTANMTPTIAAIWKHPIFGLGGVYVGTGGLDLFQFDLDGTITVNLGASISGQGSCTLTLPGVTSAVPAGDLGAVVFTAQPKVTLAVSGKLAINTSVTLKCGAEYRWNAGKEDTTRYCSASNQPLALTSDTGAKASATAAIDASVTLDDIAGITGQLNAGVDVNYTPTSHPIATIDAKAGYEIGACLACFWSGSPAQATILSGTFFTKRIATIDTPLPAPASSTAPLAITTTSLPAGTVGQAYRAGLTSTGGTGPYTWAISAGTLPPGLALEPSTGTITGTPTAVGITSFTATTMDSRGATAAATFNLGTQPARPLGLTGVKSIASSGTTAYAIKSDGTVWAWGNNDHGQLGNGTTANSNIPVEVTGLTGATAITAKDSIAYALLQDGTIRAWGWNLNGQLGDGTTTDSSIPVRVGGITGATAITTTGDGIHGFTAYALLQDGTVRAWGYNGNGELGNGTATNSSVPVQVTGLAGTAAVRTNEHTAYALLQDGTVRAWGNSLFGQLGNGTAGPYVSSRTPVPVTGITGATAITANHYNAYALLQDGTVRAWGYNGSGELGNGSTYGSTPYSSTPVQVTGLTATTAITASDDTAYALLQDGTVRAWGWNNEGQLGNGTTTMFSTTPVPVTGITGATAVTADHYTHAAYALLRDGTVRAWGTNNGGQLGNGTTTTTSVPVQVTGLTGITAIAARYNTAYALMADGTVRAWGYNYSGQLGNGTTTDSSVPVEVGVTAGP